MSATRDAESRRRQSGGVGESENQNCLVEDEAFVVRRRGFKNVGAGRGAQRQRETTIDKSHVSSLSWAYPANDKRKPSMPRAMAAGTDLRKIFASSSWSSSRVVRAAQQSASNRAARSRHQRIRRQSVPGARSRSLRSEPRIFAINRRLRPSGSTPPKNGVQARWENRCSRRGSESESGTAPRPSQASPYWKEVRPLSRRIAGPRDARGGRHRARA